MIDQEAYKDVLQRARSGDPFAQTLLGFIFEHGSVVTRDGKRAQEWYMRAAKQGYAPAKYALAISNNDNNTVGLLKEAADSGYAAAEYLLGVLYLDGKVVDKDLNISLEYMNKAVDQGYLLAIRHLAELYSDGTGVKRDAGRAAALLKAAADKGDASAAYLYGSHVVETGSKKDVEVALKYIWQAASSNNFYANVFLGEMFGQGLYGVKKSKELSRVFLSRARQHHPVFDLFSED